MTDTSERSTVLIVEDNADQREMLCDVVRSHGYSAVAFPDGQEALDQLDLLECLCLVIVDLRMPIMGGERFLEALRSHTEFGRVSALVLTGDVESARRLEGDGVDVLIKPYDMGSLLSAVRQSCARAL